MAATLDVIDLNHALATAQALPISWGQYDGEHCAASRPARPRSRDERMIMTDNERTIYNKLGSSSSPKGKVRTVLFR